MADVAVTSGSRGGPPAPQGAGGFLRSVQTFYHDVMAELRKVTWPERETVQKATVAIIIFVLLFALVIFLLDAVLSGVLQKLIPSLFVR